MHPDEPDYESDHEPEAGGGRLVRLNKYLADLGLASRRKCDELIAEGKVSIDGRPVTQLGTKVDPEKSRVEVEGELVKPLTGHRYYLLNKPKGVICTNEEREARPRAIDLITDPRKGRIYTVGRLDEESQGLILLTNDGDFANQVAHPRHGVAKTYWAKVRGRIEGEALETIRKGVHLSEGRTAGAELRIEKRTNDFTALTITLHEGKNREVRRIFAAVGFKVQTLRRTRIGNLTDRRLREGDWRPLTGAEVEDLLAVSRGDRTVATPEFRGRPARTGGARRNEGRGRPPRERSFAERGERSERRPAREFTPHDGPRTGSRSGPRTGPRGDSRTGSRTGPRTGARTGPRTGPQKGSRSPRPARGGGGRGRAR